MRNITKLNSLSSQAGMASIFLFIFAVLILLGVFIGLDFAYVSYTQRQNIYPTVTPYPGQVLTPITAHGSFSKDKYSIDITLNFALEGGSVTGKFSGDCSGNITGYYDGKDGGAISGKAVGSCDPLLVPIPASATFTGNVFHKQKNIPITGTGSAAGISGNGSLTLSF